MAERTFTDMPASVGNRTIRDLPSQRSYVNHQEKTRDYDIEVEEPAYDPQGRDMYHTRAGSSWNSRDVRNTSWGRTDHSTRSIEYQDAPSPLRPQPLSPRCSNQSNVSNNNADPQYADTSRRFSAATREVENAAPTNSIHQSNSQRRFESHEPEDSIPQHHPEAFVRPNEFRQPRSLNRQSHSRNENFHNDSVADTSPWSRLNGQRQSLPAPQQSDRGSWSQRRSQRPFPSEPQDLDATPSPMDESRTSTRFDAEDYLSDPQINRGLDPSGPPSLDTYAPRQSFRTAEDEARALELLRRDKDVKIEKRSWSRRLIMPKSKRTTFSQREIFRVLKSIIDGHEVERPGVVEVLLGMFVKAGGDINFVPQQSSTLGVISKRRPDEPSGLLEKATTCSDVDVVQLLSRLSNKTAKNNAFEIARHNRNTTSGRDVTKEERIIHILITDGVDVDSTIGFAVAAVDEKLLQMLLDGSTPVPAVSDALPAASATPDTLARRRMTSMLLRKGADVNIGNGQAILEATKLFDMVLLDMLLERRPHETSLNQAFAVALSYPDSNRRFEACQRLIDRGATGAEVNKALVIAMTVEIQNIDFLRLILRGASVDFEDGHAICQAVTGNHQDHLQLLLAKRPNEHSFDSALQAALRLRNPRDQMKFCRILVAAGPPQNSCSKALVFAVTGQKDEICRILLEAGASADHDRGASITAAARSEFYGILELLIGGEFQKPHHTSLIGAFEASLLSASSKRMKTIRLILEAGLEGQPLDTALVNATKQGQEGMALCELLLKHGASVNTRDGEALESCCRARNLVLLEKLLNSKHRPAQDVLSKVFQTSLALNPEDRPRAMELILKAGKTIDNQVAAALDSFVQERRPHMPSIETLLFFHASVHHEGHRPLITAAKNLNIGLLTLLLEHSRDGSASSKVFAALMADESFWKRDKAFDIFILLIEHGARGITVDDALIRALKDSRLTARHFEMALLQHANIDHKEGEALQIATGNGEAALVRRMLAMKPGSLSVSMAFPYALVSGLSEATCLAVIQAFMDLAAQDLYPDMHPELPDPPVFLCIKHYPHSKTVLEATLDAGFDVDQAISSEDGRMTALYWVLSEEKKIGDHMVECLIDRRANLNNHPEPLLHMAIEHGRTSVVQALIAAGADVNEVDESGLSPLSLAAQKQDIIIMQALLAAKPLSNDGSLHEAARTVNAEAIELLLGKGHDPNFPCPRFEGRPPLFELCLKAPEYLLKSQLTTEQKSTAVRKAIECLVNGKALTKDRLPRAGNRSLLMHAIDSSSPSMMVRALLQCGQFKYINDRFNLFMDGEYTYSLTKYVEKGKSRGDNSQAQSLIILLKDFGAKDRYWKIDGPQPPDMIDPPEDIAIAEQQRSDAEKRKREEEEERRREVEKRHRELVAEQAKMDRENREFLLRQARDAKLHQATIAKENDRIKVQEARNSLALKQATSMSQLRNGEEEARHRRTMKAIGEKKMLAQSQEALYFAYNKGIEDAAGPSGRRPLGPSSSRQSNFDLGRARLRIEGVPGTIEEID
ncbi:hypothetical protein VTL71DRAFT_11563 [Oculimacula yallundae]|uniref:Ankyrin n=1 Tax=Oculimacula yallundae TaxID=86028 RepID=A0ABR4CQU9_9HELO